MDNECKDKCLSAGIALLRNQQSYKATETTPILFAANVKGLVRDMKVPHSELAMHTQAAGKEILAWVLTRNYAYVVFDDDGCCGLTHGLPDEVLSHELLKRTDERFPTWPGRLTSSEDVRLPEQERSE